MTQPRQIGPITIPSWKTLLALAFALPAVGAPLILGALSVYHRLLVGGVAYRHFLLPPLSEQLRNAFLLSLTVNLAGALFLAGTLASWRRVRRS